MSDNEITFNCHPDMVQDVQNIFMHGEYEVPVEFSGPPRILDIGANMGAFAVWAKLRWGARWVSCYEPNPKALAFLRSNVDAYTAVTELAVSSVGGEVKLFDGAENIGQTGMCSLSDFPKSLKKEYTLVNTVHPNELPRCELLKIDTEGCELDILEHYDLSDTLVVMYEWHRTADKAKLTELMESRGFYLYSEYQRCPWLGVARWIRRDQSPMQQLVEETERLGLYDKKTG